MVDEKEEYEKWFLQAEADLGKVRVLLESGDFDGATFYSQQATEKAMKALIIKNKNQLPRVHDLLALCKMIDCPNEVREKCKVINPYYIETRYPDFLDKIPAESFNKEETEKVLKLCEEILEWVKKNLF